MRYIYSLYQRLQNNNRDCHYCDLYQIDLIFNCMNFILKCLCFLTIYIQISFKLSDDIDNQFWLIIILDDYFDQWLFKWLLITFIENFSVINSRLIKFYSFTITVLVSVCFTYILYNYYCIYNFCASNFLAKNRIGRISYNYSKISVAKSHVSNENIW